MHEKCVQPQCMADFREQGKPILTRLAADCNRFENRPVLLRQSRSNLEYTQALIKYAEGRENAAQSLRVEVTRLRAQVSALQAVLALKIPNNTVPKDATEVKTDDQGVL